MPIRYVPLGGLLAIGNQIGMLFMGNAPNIPMPISKEGLQILDDDSNGNKYVLESPDGLPLYNQCIQRLSQRVGCDPRNLKREMELVKPLARKTPAINVCSPREI